MKTVDIHFLLRTLKDRYPDVKTQLVHQTPFQLLTATILSAQCTDRQVNRVTGHLFAQFPDPASLAAADLRDIKQIIYSTGFYNNKAKNIKACARAVMERHAGQVPEDLDLLVKLPGVGRKTANVVRSAAFGQPAIVVDTHVLRIANRLGLTKSSDPVKVEFDLMKIVPEPVWSDLSLQFIYFGREICDARTPKCGICPLFDICVFPGKKPKIP
jgi:endonuclease-3